MDITTFSDALKDYYTDDKVEELQIRDRPLLAYIDKFEKFQGGSNGTQGLPIPVQYGDPQNVSSNFGMSQAREAQGTTQLGSFLLTRTFLYNFVTISTEVMEASESDTGAWLDARTTEINNGLEAVNNRLAQLAYRSGWGEVGIVGSISGSTITLSDVTMAYNFENGMMVGFSSSLNAAVLRGAGTTTAKYLTVSGVNHNTGVITFSAAVSTITDGASSVVTNGDYIFTQGDRQDSATPSMVVPAGLEGWAPAGGVSGGDSWFGQNRSVDSRLYGVSYNGASDAPEDAILTTASRMAELGQTATHCFTSYRQFNKIVKNQRIYERFLDKMSIDIGFSGIMIVGPKGPIKVLPDQFCPNTRAWLIDKKAIKLYSLKKAVRILDNDGLMALRQPSADGVEVRMGFKGNIASRAPAGLGNCQLTAV